MATAMEEDFKNEVLRLAGEEGKDLHSVRHLLGQLSHGSSYETEHKKIGQALSGGQTGRGPAQ